MRHQYSTTYQIQAMPDGFFVYSMDGSKLTVHNETLFGTRDEAQSFVNVMTELDEKADWWAELDATLAPMALPA